MRNRIASVEFNHYKDFNLERAWSDKSIKNLSGFIHCMYRNQIDYVSFEFIVFYLSGLPRFDVSPAWDKAQKCGFQKLFGEEDKGPIIRLHRPKYYADVLK